MASTSTSRLPYSKSQSQLQPQSQPQSQSPRQSPERSQYQRSSSAQTSSSTRNPQHSSFARSASHPSGPGHTRQDEKNFVARYEDRQDIVPPEHIEHDSVKGKLGFSSRKLRVTDFELMKTLGTGTFARVWLARLAGAQPEDRNKVFALKVLRKVDVIKLKQVEHVRNERNVLAAVAGYPFITTLVTSFADDTSLYMLLDYTPGGEIFSYLRRARRFPFPTVQFYAAEITLILAYLHDIFHVAYRDLKPENILLDANGHLKLVDFGFAKYLPPAPPGGDTGEGGEVGPEGHGRGVTYTLCGTPEYLAPEVIRNQGHGMAVDWWALGILVYEMLIGQPPFWDQNPMRIYEQIVAGHIRFPSSTHSFHINTISKQFILALCRTDPAQRLGHIAGGSARVMRHQFFDGVDWDALYYKKTRGPIVPRVEWAGDAGNFDDYPEPDATGESEGERGSYTEELRRDYEAAFQDF